MRKFSVYCLVLFVILVVLVWLNNVSSYSRRIGDTNFYLVETMTNSKDGKPLAGLFYKMADEGGYAGEMSSGFPKSILWNERYLISKNYDGIKPDVIMYVVIDMDSIEPLLGRRTGIHVFEREEDYSNFMKQINIKESEMNQTDNHIGWW